MTLDFDFSAGIKIVYKYKMEKIVENRSPFRVIAVSGLIAGFIFMLMEMLLAAATSPDGLLGPPRMIAAIVMGESLLKPGIQTGIAVVVVSLFVHFALSITYTGIFFAVVQKMKVPFVLLTGIVFGLVIYLINFYAFSEIFFWFSTARNWMSMLSHLVFGFTAAFCITRMYSPPAEMDQSPPAKKQEAAVKEKEQEEEEILGE